MCEILFQNPPLTPPALAILQVRVLGIPNDVLLCAAGIGGLFLAGSHDAHAPIDSLACPDALSRPPAGLMINIAYRPSRLHHSKHVIAVLRIIKQCQYFGGLLALLGVFLTTRCTDKIKDPNRRDAYTKSYYSLMRAIFAFLVGSTPFVIQVSPIIRIANIATLVVLVSFDCMSEIYFASQVECVTMNLCVNANNKRVWDFLYMVRDLASIFIEAFLVTAIVWGTTHMGFLSNRIILPKSEHRKTAQTKDIENKLRSAMDVKDFKTINEQLRLAETLGIQSNSLELARSMAKKYKDE